MTCKNKIISLVALFLVMAAFSFTVISKRTIKSSEISFTIKNLGLNVDGTLGNLIVNVFEFDDDSLSSCKISASVDVSTIKTGIGKRDEHLKQTEYFNAAAHPKISLVSTRFARAKAGNVIGYFKLTIKGVTKDVMLPIYVDKTADGASFKTEFSVNRLDYRVGTTSNVLSDIAKITIFVKTN